MNFTPPPGKAGSVADPLIDRTIDGKYCITAKLGSGGMGAVYRAGRVSIGDEVAVKILHPGHLSELQANERFRREAQAAARLKHPNAVTIYDFGVTSDGLLYLVMELVEGQSLREVIKTQGPLPPSAAAEVIAQVCAVLDEAHRQQIIHRDIKPDNIMVSQGSSGLRVKVLDFGIAKVRDVTVSNLTQAGGVVGTPHYMSPEQCLGSEVDARSDIYSLGIVLYEMLAGVVPFNSPTSTAVVVQHVNQRPPSVRAMNLSISEDVERVVMHTLEKRPEFRPQTAGELARELSGAVSQWKGTPANSEVFADASFKGGTIFPSVAAPTMGLTPTVVLPRPSRDFSTGAPGGSDAPDNRSRNALVAIGLLAVVLVGTVVYLLTRDDNRSVESTESASSSATRVHTRTPTAQQTQPVSTGLTANTVLWKASCRYAGVNIRATPDRNAALIATIGIGEQLLVFKESTNYDTVVIASERKSVTANWSEVEIAGNPSVHGWVFNGFITKD